MENTTMTVQATLIVSGNVQSVGYREYVYRQAMRIGLTGLVRNIGGKKVWIVCEGETGQVEEFERTIRVNDALAKVTDIRMVLGEPKGCFDTFLVTRDLRYNGLPEAKMEDGIRYLGEILKAIDRMHKDIGERIDRTSSNTSRMDNNLGKRFDRLHGRQEATLKAIKTMDSNMGRRFDSLDRKYGAFGRTMRGMARDIKKTRKDTKSMAGNLKTMGCSIKTMEDSMKTMGGGVKSMAADFREIRKSANSRALACQ